MQYFLSDSVFSRNVVCRSPKSVCDHSVLQAKVGIRYDRTYASRFSSASMVRWICPCFLPAKRPLLIFPAAAGTRKWGNFPVNSGSLTRLISTLCFHRTGTTRGRSQVLCFIIARLGEKFPVISDDTCAEFRSDHHAQSLACGAGAGCGCLRA